MTVRTLQFDSLWLDEPQFDSYDNVTEPGAKSLVEAIASQLADAADDISEIEQHSHYGWSFTCSHAGQEFFNVLNPAGPECFLTFEPAGGGLTKMVFGQPGSGQEAYAEMLLNNLRRIPDLSNFRWVDA